MAINYGQDLASIMGKPNDMNRYAEGFGINASQGNPAVKGFRRGLAALMPDFYSRIGFMNELGPGRQDAIRNNINQFSPGQQNATAEMNRKRLLQQGQQSAMNARARLAGLGASQDAQAGTQIAGQNRAEQASNDYSNTLFSPVGQAQVNQGLMGAYGQAQDLNTDVMSQLAQLLTQYDSFREARGARGGGLGGALGGALGSALGGVNLGNLFGGGGGGWKGVPYA